MASITPPLVTPPLYPCTQAGLARMVTVAATSSGGVSTASTSPGTAVDDFATDPRPVIL